VPAVAAEEEPEIRRVADTAIWDPRHDADALDEPISRIKREILERKPYLRA
jgi:hypothetical protein